MRAAGVIAQRYTMGFAGASAIHVALAGRKEAREDAVLGVKNRQMLIGDGLDTVGAHLARKGSDLIGIQIVSGRQHLDSEREEFLGGAGVGGIQAEIADEAGAAAESLQQPDRKR